jgi:translocation and assembly module TamB
VTRRRIALLFTPALLLLLVAGGFAWLLHSEAGARWILQRAASTVPGQLRYRETHGDLQSGLRVAGLAYHDDALSVEADRVGLRLSLDFWPPAVSVHNLEFGQLVIRAGNGPEAEEAANPADWLPQLGLPVPVKFERVRGERLDWFGAAPEPVLAVRELELAGFWFRELELREAHARFAGSRWKANLTFSFQPPHELALNLEGTVEAPDGQDSSAPLALTARASGDLGQARWELQLDDPPLAASGELSDLLGTLRWDLQMNAGRLQWPLAGTEPSLVLQNLAVSSYGTLDDYGLEFAADLSGPGIPPTPFSAVGSGNLSGVDFERLGAAGDSIRFDGSGRVDWQSTPEASATLEVSRFSPAYWLEAWGDAEPLRGRLQLSWSGQRLGFELADVAAAGTLAAAEGSGALDLGDGTLAAELAWQGFAWPPGAAEAVVASGGGRASLGGHLEAWTVSGELDLSGPDFPPGRLQVRGGGDAESLHLEVPRGDVLGGRLAGELDVRWSPDLSWAVAADVENLSTAPLAPDFPGRVSGTLAVRGRPQPPALEIDIQGLSGVVRERPVQAQGQLLLESGRIVARGLQIRSGQSRLALDGHQASARGLSFTAEIHSLSDLLDDASGSFKGTGIVALDANRPRLRLDGQGRDLAWGENSVAAVSIATGPEPGEAIRLEIEGLELGDQRIDRVRVEASGERPLDRLEGHAESAGGSLDIRLQGRVMDWSDLTGGGWAGELQSLRLSEHGPGFIELEQPVAATLNGNTMALERACFRGSLAGRLCLETNWSPRGGRSLAASLEEISPNLAMTLLDSELSFSQRVSGVFEWRQAKGAKPTALLRLQISEGEITLVGEEETLLATGAGWFGFELAEGRLYGGNLDIPIPGSGAIDTDFGAPDLAAGLGSPVQGRIRVNLNSIEPLLRLLPGIEGSSGPLAAELDFSGTLADPELTGHVSLVRGSISHEATGLLLEELRLAGSVYRYDQAELSGTFRAGSGEGSIRTVLNFSNLLEPELLLQVQGDDLTLVDVPGLNVTATPDVRLVWREGILSLDGKVIVPAARLSPLILPVSAATESPDLVIVAGHDPLAEQQADAPRERRLRGSLELELGDDVRLLLDRAKAQLRGGARFTWDGPALPVADGGFTLGGEILAYGQLLKVTEGRVNFSNRPADNPFLNIRAEREIFGNSQVTRAGVLVTGTLKEPVVEPYSVPMTTRERALTLLITGSDFDYEQGVGSVEVGMYVAPKLFISYGIGLFEDQNVISARYDLGKGFGIKTTSGQRETGADISYTIER